MNDGADDTLVNSVAPSKELLEQVKQITALREGDAVNIKRLRAKEPFGAYLRVSKQHGSFFVTYIVAALSGTLTDDVFDVFCRSILARLRRDDKFLRAILVYDGELAAEDLSRRAR